MGRGIALERRHQVGPRILPDRRAELQRIVEGLADQIGRHVGMVEALGEAMGKRRLEAVVVEHIGDHHRGKRRLRRHDALGVVAHRIPHRIKRFDALSGIGVGSHGSLHREMPI
jgi:hypothetical protein